MKARSRRWRTSRPAPYRTAATTTRHTRRCSTRRGLPVDRNVTPAHLKGRPGGVRGAYLRPARRSASARSYFPFVEPGPRSTSGVYSAINQTARAPDAALQATRADRDPRLRDDSPRRLGTAGSGSDEWSGFALGMGPERTARSGYVGSRTSSCCSRNDPRFLAQFEASAPTVRVRDLSPVVREVVVGFVTRQSPGCPFVAVSRHSAWWPCSRPSTSDCIRRPSGRSPQRLCTAALCLRVGSFGLPPTAARRGGRRRGAPLGVVSEDEQAARPTSAGEGDANEHPQSFTSPRTIRSPSRCCSARHPSG